MITIATWNVNSVRSRLCHITSWLEVNEVDILCLQETKVQDSDFPKEIFLKLGFKTEFLGQKSYNGVCILFNKKAELYCKNVPGLEDEQKRLIAITQSNSLFINIYVPNGSSLGSEKFENVQIAIQEKNMLNILTTSYDDISNVLNISKNEYD